ncbi:MAG: hypothetical protein QXO76_06885 [Thermoproteota archaeon]
MVVTVTTGGDGMFTHVFTVGEAGSWIIRATREGNATHEAAENTVSITVEKNKVSVSCSVSKQRITLGETIIVSGAMNPPIPGGAVSLLFTRPNGETFSVMVETLADGSFSHSFKPEEKGEWRVEARWGGSLNYGSAASPLTIFTVEEPFPITYVMLGVTIIIIGLAGWFFAKRKGKSKS